MKILNTDNFVSILPLVKSANVQDEDGIFGDIFGTTDIERRRKLALIDLNCRIVHPIAFKMLKRLSKIIEDIILMKNTYFFDEDTNQFVVDPNGSSGMSFLLEHFDKLQFRTDTPERQQIAKVVKEEPIFIRYLVVIPPALRPYSSEIDKLSPINEMYIKILKLSNSISLSKDLDLTNSLIAEMQKLVNELFKILSELNKKQGIIRNNILGKRVDFSARSVVSPGPDIPLGYVGVPFKIVVKIFEPFVLHYLLKKNVNKREFESLLQKYKLSFTYFDIKILLDMISKGFITEKDEIYSIVKQYAEMAVKDKVVILKRDPALHRLSLQVCYVKIIDDDVIRVPPYIIQALNMDFDGDTAALYVPLSDEAIKEAKEKMFNINKPTTVNKPYLSVKNDVYAGIYQLTKAYNN